MRVLLLGGIMEAVNCANLLQGHLAARGHTLIYSLAGKARHPNLGCQVRVGGFGGASGLKQYLHSDHIDLVIDATHPYAAQMSRNAKIACAAAGVALWAYRRPPWQINRDGNWQWFTDWAQLTQLLAHYTRPFFSIGQLPFNHLNTIPDHQHWYIRCYRRPQHQPEIDSSHVTIIESIGPFTLEEEVHLFDSIDIDVLIAKNSGGDPVKPKLNAAGHLGIPILMLPRPLKPEIDTLFDNVEVLVRKLMYDYRFCD